MKFKTKLRAIFADPFKRKLLIRGTIAAVGATGVVAADKLGKLEPILDVFAALI